MNYSGWKRGKTYTVFHHQGVHIYKKTFLFLHCMSGMHIKSIKVSYLANGVVARVHSNKGRSRKVELSLKKEIKDAVHTGQIVISVMAYTSMKNNG